MIPHPDQATEKRILALQERISNLARESTGNIELEEINAEIRSLISDREDAAFTRGQENIIEAQAYNDYSE